MDNFISYLIGPFMGGEFVGDLATRLGLSELGGIFLWLTAPIAWVIILGTIVVIPYIIIRVVNAIYDGVRNIPKLMHMISALLYKLKETAIDIGILLLMLSRTLYEKIVEYFHNRKEDLWY